MERAKGKGRGSPKNNGKSTGKRNHKAKNQVPTKRDTRKGSKEEARGSKGRRKSKRETKRESQSMDNKVINIIAELLDEVPAQNVLSLFEFENTKRHTHMYLYSARERESPSSNMIPRLVRRILIRFHPRRDWSGGRASPNSQKITVFLISLANRIRWKWYFRDKEKSNLSPALESLLLS